MAAPVIRRRFLCQQFPPMASINLRFIGID
jgi:hypothetical protein